MGHTSGPRWSGLGAAAGVALAPLCFDLPAPIFWLSISWSLAIFATLRTLPRAGARVVAGGIAIALLVLGALEGLLWGASSDRAYAELRTEGRRITAPHPLLGHSLRPNQRERSERYYAGEPIFAVEYSTDARGLRRSPTALPTATQSALFFGGSYTFGDGVEDDETLPFRVGVRSAGQLQVYNFGVSGYGPHQMLAAIEHGLVADRVEATPYFAIYQAVPHHVYRAAGSTPWGRNGPRYALGENGLIFSGRFDAGPAGFEWLRAQLDKSLLYNAAFGSSRPLAPGDFELFAQIVQQAKEQLAASYPGIEFHVLLWETPELAASRALRAPLAARGIELHRVAEILGTSERTPPEFMLSPHDPHPNALAHDRIAAYVVDEIIRPQTPRGAISSHSESPKGSLY